jgi:hypothetical protein
MPRQATAFSRLLLGTSSDVKPLTLSNVAFGVIGAVLNVRRLFLVFTDKQTFSEPVITSHLCRQ